MESNPRVHSATLRRPRSGINTGLWTLKTLLTWADVLTIVLTPQRSSFYAFNLQTRKVPVLLLLLFIRHGTAAKEIDG